MVKKVTRKKSKTPYQRELAKLKKEKVKRLKQRKVLLARKKEIEEIKKIKREINKLKGVGTKRAVAKRLGLTGAKTAGKYSWKGLKMAGKFVKGVVEREAAAQDREAAMEMRRRKRKR